MTRMKSKVRVRTVEYGAMGNARFYADNRSRNSSAWFYWNGPGSPLYLETMYGDLHRIEHPSADGQYDTHAEAMAAVRRFMERGS